MEQLNPGQLAAVRHATGPLLILAGAGTGKTRVATERMARLMRTGVPARNLLGVTFTNKAANEMRERVQRLSGRAYKRDELVVCTFHSLCVRLIRRDAPLLGFTPSFSICDQGEQLAATRKAASTVKGCAELKPEDLLSRLARLKNRGLSPDEFRRAAVDDDEHTLASVYRRYQDSLRRQNCLDFDDLLLHALRLLRDNAGVLEHWRDRFRYIMVDEFQDTNPAQFELVRLLAAPRNNLCVVGDDDQSIYAWRGAMAGNILKFRDSYPGAVEVTLEQNYRSTSTILSAANAVIRNNSGRREKNLWSDLGRGTQIRLRAYNDQFEEAAGIVADIRQRLSAGGGLGPGDVAVIIRANAQSRLLEDEFIASRLPYEVIGGQSLFDRKESRDVLAFLSAIANPEADNQILRIINVPPRGIGDKSLDLLMAQAARRGGGLSRLLAEPNRVEGMAAPAAEACKRFAAMLEGWRKRVAESGPAGIVRTVLEETGYSEELTHLYRDPLESAARWNQALAVEDTLASYLEANGGTSAGGLEQLADFLREAALVGRRDDDGPKRNGNAVKIITAHSAKGLEFPCVYIPGLEEELFPHKNSLEDAGVEEERRLFYVAMTRARRELTLTRARARVLRGKEHKREPSRFLAEIPGEFLEVDDTPTREDEIRDWLAELRGKMAKKEEG